MQKVSQSDDRAFGGLKVWSNQQGDPRSYLLGWASPGPSFHFPTRNIQPTQLGERQDGPQSITAASSSSQVP